MKASVTLCAQVGTQGQPSCSRTGSGKYTTDAFTDAKSKLTTGLKVHTAPEGQNILVKIVAGSKRAEGSADTLDAAIAAAWKSLLEKQQGGGHDAAR